MWFCYILRCITPGHTNLTYNGSTNCLSRRLRQHNGEIKGGAKATKGKKWEFYAIVTGFPNHKNALSCEWRIKHPTNSKKRPQKYCGIHGRINGLNLVMSTNKWTKQCEDLNEDNNFTLYVTTDVLDDINLDKIPNNIDVYKVNKMGKKFVKLIEETPKHKEN